MPICLIFALGRQLIKAINLGDRHILKSTVISDIKQRRQGNKGLYQCFHIKILWSLV